MIRLKRLKDKQSYYFRGKKPFFYHYVVVYDFCAGSKGRYTVIRWDCDGSNIVGRELPLKDVRQVIAQIEKRGW